MRSFQKYLIIPIISLLIFIGAQSSVRADAAISDLFKFIAISDTSVVLDIGDTWGLSAISSTLKRPTWKSSNTGVATVNSYGVITAKKAGTAIISANASNITASCVVTVRPTTITLSRTSVVLENSDCFLLRGEASTGHPVKWKSSKTSVVSVSEFGLLTAKKPGSAVITATVDGATKECRVTVKPPTLIISSTEETLERGDTLRLTCKTSSGLSPSWRSSKSSVATVDEDGVVTAVKHGTAKITAKLDGVQVTCVITVVPPVITLSHEEIDIPVGTTLPLTAEVSSGMIPSWRSSNPGIVTVNDKGVIKGIATGTAYVYVSEDGAKVRCTVHVTEAGPSAGR